MNKKLVAIAVAAAFTAPLAAQAETTVFGKVHLSVSSVEEKANGVTTVDNIQVQSHASRLGFKGSHDLGGGMKANYHLEWEVNPDSDGKSTDATTGNSNDGTAGIKRRNQWIGLGGGWGEVRFGRHDTPLKIAQGKFDQFNDTNADIKGVGAISQGENRLDNVIAYIGKFGDVTFAAASVPSEGTVAEANTKGDGISDTISVALMYGAGPLFVSIAQDSYDDTQTKETDSLTRAVATYKMGTMQLGLLYETGGDGDKSDDKDVTGVSFGMGVGGSNKVKLQYVSSEDSQTTKVEETQSSVGFDHKFNKQTTGYILYTTAEEETGGVTTEEFDQIALGMIVNF